MNILCIDDEPLALRLLVSMLQDKPNVEKLHSFDNTADALACAKTEKIDIAFVDIMLGSANGLDFAQNLRSLQPNCKIIYCTGYPQYAIESINRGIVDGYLLKPIEEKQIEEILNSICAHKLLTVTGSGNQIHIVDRQGQPVVFKRRKIVQLFSLLLEQKGEDATVDELCEQLWDHKKELISKNRQYLYSLVNAMSDTFKEHDAQGVLVKTANGYALDMSQIEIN
ncbi:MAG: response regulator [Clostridiales bacterium]|nr:response regulator [Candidatus Crickella equi]